MHCMHSAFAGSGLPAAKGIFNHLHDRLLKTYGSKAFPACLNKALPDVCFMWSGDLYLDKELHAVHAYSDCDL